MDKYEYNLKLEEIDKLVDQGDYAEAAGLADTIDWRRVRNVRTLCLISEIYEASDRLEDSKAMLVRAYRRSPVGRNVLYRLVEVTTKLQQYDEAIEYYTEYVQAAPHDNNRYILKYKIYKGRGSSVEELIAILEEYLGQEYTERWAYELATLYQQSGQIQKCLAACDDLVLWFHSGKYVARALELKKRYAALTPKQQQIYEECMQERLETAPEVPEVGEDNVIQNVESTDGEVIAETIMAETEKEIADQVSARKAELEKAEAAADPAGAENAPGQAAAGGSGQADPGDTRVMSGAGAQAGLGDTRVMPGTGAQAGLGDTRVMPGTGAQADPGDTRVMPGAGVQANLGDTRVMPGAGVQADLGDTRVIPGAGEQAGLGDTRVMPETGAQAALEPEESEEERQAELAKSMRKIIAGVVKRTEVNEEDLPASVDSSVQNVQKLEMPETSEQVAGQLSIDDILLSMSDKGRKVADAVLEADGENEPAEQPRERGAVSEEPEDLNVEEMPVEPQSRTVADDAARDLTDAQKEALRYTNHPEKLLRNRNSLPTYSEEDDDLGKTRRIVNTKEELLEAAKKEILAEKTIRIPTEQISRRLEESGEMEELYESQEEFPAPEDGLQGEEGAYEEPEAQEEYEYEYEEEEYLTIPPHLRGLFGGFTEVEGLEDQIANAIIQAESKGDDKTSRSGNILIFGAHGSGKTTLAMNIAKAIAQDKGNQVMKMARIYAADLNRKDIAATVAKIAGGTLIIEEAGDLEPGVVEQLTTAMEFRTDGLVVILEDEQQYIHELLMRHPRFTMKFTAQIYIPVYTVDELAAFGQIYANAQDYVIGEEGYEALCQKISDGAMAAETPLTISDVIAMVGQAISRSNKFFRKLSMGKKRYDENDYIILFPKDFK